jgi:ATP-dependent DNA helicase DinG
MVQEVFVNAERMAAGSEADVLWLGEGRDRSRRGCSVAPLQVWGRCATSCSPTRPRSSPARR